MPSRAPSGVEPEGARRRRRCAAAGNCASSPERGHQPSGASSPSPSRLRLREGVRPPLPGRDLPRGLLRRLPHGGMERDGATRLYRRRRVPSTPSSSAGAASPTSPSPPRSRRVLDANAEDCPGRSGLYEFLHAGVDRRGGGPRGAARGLPRQAVLVHWRSRATPRGRRVRPLRRLRTDPHTRGDSGPSPRAMATASRRPPPATLPQPWALLVPVAGQE